MVFSFRLNGPGAALVLGLGLLFSGPVAGAAPDRAGKIEFFEKQIRPLLINRCSKCHGEKKQEAGLRVDQSPALFRGGKSGRVVQPGRPEKSLLLARVRARGDQQMPPRSRLSVAQLAALQRWIAEGAVWPRGTGKSEPTADRNAIVPIEPDAAAVARSLELWLRADKLSLKDGERVSVWPDASGRGHDLSVTAGVRTGGTGTAPLFVAHSDVNRRPAVRFARINGLAGSPDHRLRITGDAAFTVVLVAKLKHDPSRAYENILFVGNPAAASDPGRPLSVLIEIEPKKKQLDLAGGWSHDASLGPGSAQVFYDRPNILSITRARGPWTAGTRFWLNGEPAAKAWGREPTGSQAVPDIQHRADIGVALGRPLGWAGGFVGDLAEVIIFNRVLTDGEREGLEATLSLRYGLVMPGMFAGAAREFSDAEKNHWSLRPVDRPELPVVADRGWAISEIDHFLLARLEAARLQPSPRADRPTLIRRVTFDLTGLPPTPAEVDAFVADPAGNREAFAAVVDRLLGSPHYGERWARHWLDVVRYAETTANDANAVMPYAWRYRDYVIGALNDDRGYDRFVVEQLAGDLLADRRGAERVDAVIATGLLMLGPKALAETDKEQSRLDIIADQLDVLGRAFLGLTIGCARCHDHKFDPIPTVDYYSLAGIFRSTEVFKDEVRNATMWQEWSLEVAGVKPLMVMAPRETTPVTLSVHRRGNRLDPGVLAPRRFLQVIAGTGHAPLQSGNSGRLELAHWIASAKHPLTARVMVNRVWQHHFGTGLVETSDNFGSRGAMPTHPRLLDWLAADFVGNGWSLKTLHRRLLVSSTYMQASRAIDDVGPRKIDPDNRLLWRMPLRRLDAESLRDAVLAASGRLDTTPGGSESGEFLYERAEVIDKKRPFFRPNRVKPDDPFYTDSRRRSIYLPVVRNALPDLLALFDGADPNGIVSRRNDTTVPSQSLFLMNHPFVLENSEALARRLLGSGVASDSDRISLGYRLTLGRSPRPRELDGVRAFLKTHMETAAGSTTVAGRRLAAWTDFCQTLFFRNEFLYVN
ncbi:MAG: hypothetical protein CMJ45_00080 [Planctomyces sp.]|nr:hypothetical protein [Planctomyces sp.]